MAYLQNLRDRHPNKTDLEIPYDYNYNLEQKRRNDWSGTQRQIWTSTQRVPMKVKFPYMIKTERVSGYVDVRGKFTHKSRDEDRSGGKWYFEDELIFATPADKFRNNSSMDGWTGGLILMTKQEAANMGMTPQQVINWYREDQLFNDSAKKTNTKPSLFFTYRSDGSITGKWKPPIIPPPAPVAEPTPVGNLNPYQLKTTIDPKWILLAIVGVGILSAMIFIMRGRK